ncbi:hypothetical protein [Reyranella soli]|uniref:hypothetical protein n=1 Tax=Reyranella soli TaxID=1230389 RepID=UPI0011BD897D|nr:hypothetical protein [Reyranella soli]
MPARVAAPSSTASSISPRWKGSTLRRSSSPSAASFRRPFKDRERIYVVPQDDLKLLTGLYAAYQTAKGWRPPTIVATLDEAFVRLGVAQADFHPIVID